MFVKYLLRAGPRTGSCETAASRVNGALHCPYQEPREGRKKGTRRRRHEADVTRSGSQPGEEGRREGQGIGTGRNKSTKVRNSLAFRSFLCDSETTLCTSDFRCSTAILLLSLGHGGVTLKAPFISLRSAISGRLPSGLWWRQGSLPRP